MQRVEAYLEIGRTRSFACALEWPGWSRSGRDEGAALGQFVAFAPRYAAVAARVAPDFVAPGSVADVTVVERLAGGAGTDFGVPGSPPAADERPLDAGSLERQTALLRAAWDVFDAAARAAEGLELRRGPRGGGRALDAIIEHVLDAEAAYVTRLGAKPQARGARDAGSQLALLREDAVDALRSRARGEPITPPSQVRTTWLPRYYARRSAWHALDHAWEIEDRSAPL